MPFALVANPTSATGVGTVNPLLVRTTYLNIGKWLDLHAVSAFFVG